MEATQNPPKIMQINPFCARDPRELQQLAVQKRKANKIASELHEREKELLAMAKIVAWQPVVQNPLHQTITQQIEMIDAEIVQADADALPKLVDAKCKLWSLLFPKPKGRGQRSMSHVETVQVVSDSGTV